MNKVENYEHRIEMIKKDIIEHTADGNEVEQLIQLQLILSCDLRFIYGDYLNNYMDVEYYSALKGAIENLIIRISWNLYNRAYDVDWLNEFDHLIDLLSNMHSE